MLQADTQVQVYRVDRQCDGDIEREADGAENPFDRTDPQQNQQGRLEGQQHIDDMRMADIPVAVNPGAEGRTQDRSDNIADSHNQPQFHIGVAGSLKEYCRILDKDAEGAPEAGCDDHIVECDR